MASRDGVRPPPPTPRPAPGGDGARGARGCHRLLGAVPVPESPHQQLHHQVCARRACPIFLCFCLTFSQARAVVPPELRRRPWPTMDDHGRPWPTMGFGWNFAHGITVLTDLELQWEQMGNHRGTERVQFKPLLQGRPNTKVKTAASRNLCRVHPSQPPAWPADGAGLYPLTLRPPDPRVGGNAHSWDFCFAKSRSIVGTAGSSKPANPIFGSPGC